MMSDATRNEFETSPPGTTRDRLLLATASGGSAIGQAAVAVTAPYNPGSVFFIESDGSGSVSVVYADGSSGTIPATSLPAGTIYPVLCRQITASTAGVLRAIVPVFV